jgi:hypothetical protein
MSKKRKSLAEMFEEAARQPVPYEGLSSDPVATGFAVEPSTETKAAGDENPAHQGFHDSFLGVAAKAKSKGDQT